MKTIQHDAQSLRQVAWRRYLRTCSRINGQHRQEVRRRFLLALVILTALCLTIVAARWATHA